VACIALTERSPQMAFYLMPLRAWQFATGALVWLYFDPSQRIRSDNNCNAKHVPISFYRYWGWLGLALIVLASLWFDANMPYPGWRAILPTAGAAAIIVAGMRGTSSGVSRILSWRPMQAVGRVSYSWYLWHWPILLLGASFSSTENAGYRIGLVVLSLLLAVLSYGCIESPIRHQARWVWRPGITVLSALALMMIANVLCIIWSNATASWQNNPDQQRYAKAHIDAPVIYGMGCRCADGRQYWGAVVSGGG
jgi:peptidoglycan/LPS O-acetylase OafA/YrhL